MADERVKYLSHEVRRRIFLDIAAHKEGEPVSAQDVVDAASNPNHPLHDHFDWDDAVAGAKHRLQQARRFISSVKVDVVVTPAQGSTPRIVKAPIAVSPTERRSEGGGYNVTVTGARTIDDVDELRANALEELTDDALNDMIRMRTRHEAVLTASGGMRTLNRLINQLTEFGGGQQG